MKLRNLLRYSHFGWTCAVDSHTTCISQHNKAFLIVNHDDAHRKKKKHLILRTVVYCRCDVGAPVVLRGAWRDRDTNDIFAHCSLIFYFLDFKFSNFVCPSERHPLIWFFFKNSFRKKKNIRKTTQNAL